MLDRLDRYAELKKQLNEIQAQAALQSAPILSELAEIENALHDHVKATGSIAAGYGYLARIKSGRKSTDHEAAFNAKMAECIEHQMHGLGSQLNELKEKFSTTKVTVAWAKVTAAAKIDVEPFTVEGEPIFVIEEAK